ncbi:MAG: hypothetical protein IPN06_10065 [Burkholderiales bacterium]|nr:hypothetical protein [Burkholderiales bacterium]
MAQAINTPARLIRKYSDFSIYALNPQTLHAPGWVTSLAFKLTDPVGSVTTYWDLLTKLWDRGFVESHSTTSDYLNNMLSYPVGMVQDLVAKMAVGNQFAKGEFKLGQKMVRFKNIKAPMLVFAGETDVLVQASAARGILDLVDSRYQLRDCTRRTHGRYFGRAGAGRGVGPLGQLVGAALRGQQRPQWGCGAGSA